MNQRKQKSPLDAHAADLNAWLTPATQGGEGIPATEAVKRLAAMGVKSSDSSISRWWKATAPERMIARITSGKEASDQLEAQFKDGGARVATLIAWLKNLVAQQAAHGEAPDIDQIVTMLRPVLEWSKLEEHRADRALDMEKFAAAMKSKIEIGLDELAESFRQHPEAMELYRRAREIVKAQTS